MFGYIRNFTKEKDIHGTLILAAFQMGGDPDQLDEKVGLAKSEKGNYYEVKCEFNDMDSCYSVAVATKAYAASTADPETFLSQFSFSPRSGL